MYAILLGEPPAPVAPLGSVGPSVWLDADHTPMFN